MASLNRKSSSIYMTGVSLYMSAILFNKLNISGVGNANLLRKHTQHSRNFFLPLHTIVETLYLFSRCFRFLQIHAVSSTIFERRYPELNLKMMDDGFRNLWSLHFFILKIIISIFLLLHELSLCI